MRRRVGLALLTIVGASLAFAIISLAAVTPPAARSESAPAIAWPAGTEIARLENLDGMVMLRMTVRGAGGRDTSGLFVLDTGAGFLALDRELATGLGIVDTAVAGRADAVDLATSPLPRMSLGNWSLDQVQPVLTIDGSVIRRVTDRPVLGLLGQRPLEDRCVVLDYGEKTATLVPMVRESEDTQVADEAADDSSDADAAARSRAAIGFALSPGAVAVRFALAGDGKILVRGRVADPRPPRWSRALNLLVDTGATKTVLFDEAVSGVIAHAGAWPTLRGLSAPTLIGAAEARLSMVPALEIAGIARRGRPRPAARVAGIDVGLIRSDLSGVLSRVTRTTIHGLLGYSFLKHFRVAIDYPHRVLWLDPIPHYRDERPYEYCHVGLELERRDGAAIVTGVAAGSPAARAGIRREDELVALDGAPSRTLDLMDLARRMEGPPGSTVTIVMRRGAVERTHRLVRRRLL